MVGLYIGLEMGICSLTPLSPEPIFHPAKSGLEKGSASLHVVEKIMEKVLIYFWGEKYGKE